MNTDKTTRIGSIALLIFVIIFAFEVGSRIDQQTISVLAGTVMGFLVASITVGGIAYALGRRRMESREGQQPVRYVSPMPQQYPMPPYFQPPANFGHGPQFQYPGWGNQPQLQQQTPMQLVAPRRFYTIGAAGTVEEMSEVLEPQERGLL